LQVYILQYVPQWEKLYEEVKAMKSNCGPGVHMKAILAIGELGSMNNVYKASLACMMAGADFIKTSTGKEGVNATLSVGVVMCRYVRGAVLTTLFYFLNLLILLHWSGGT
jgi:deoxyribose-phosphate aldolase